MKPQRLTNESLVDYSTSTLTNKTTSTLRARFAVGFSRPPPTAELEELGVGVKRQPLRAGDELDKQTQITNKQTMKHRTKKQTGT